MNLGEFLDLLSIRPHSRDQGIAISQKKNCKDYADENGTNLSSSMCLFEVSIAPGRLRSQKLVSPSDSNNILAYFRDLAFHKQNCRLRRPYALNEAVCRISA